MAGIAPKNNSASNIHIVNTARTVVGFMTCLRPGVLAAVEETVLVVFGRGLAARLDVGLLGRHCLDRRPRGELLEPALEVRLAVDVGAVGLVLARPWEGCHVGDRIFVAAEIFRLTPALVEQLLEPQ